MVFESCVFHSQQCGHHMRRNLLNQEGLTVLQFKNTYLLTIDTKNL